MSDEARQPATSSNCNCAISFCSTTIQSSERCRHAAIVAFALPFVINGNHKRRPRFHLSLLEYSCGCGAMSFALYLQGPKTSSCTYAIRRMSSTDHFQPGNFLIVAQIRVQEFGESRVYTSWWMTERNPSHVTAEARYCCSWMLLWKNCEDIRAILHTERFFLVGKS